MLAKGILWQHLADIDNQAQQMFDTLVEHMKKDEGVTEELKEQNQLEWVQKMNSIQAQAIEIVYNELIYI